MTINSPEASGLPSAPLRMPGPCLISVAVSPPKPELSSAPELPRRMIALSVRPVSFSVAWKPWAIASRATKTATTPARPTTMTSEDAQRSGTDFRLIEEMARI